MIILDITNDEDHLIYRSVESANRLRQYDYLRSVVAAALAMRRPFLSESLIKALHYHAVAGLVARPGEYRISSVRQGAREYPAFTRVPGMMEDFINRTNRDWETSETIELAAFVYWRLIHIHPFSNGNGRTARAASYFVICLKEGGWLPGLQILPDRMRREISACVDAFLKADETIDGDLVDTSELQVLMGRMLDEQRAAAEADC